MKDFLITALSMFFIMVELKFKSSSGPGSSRTVVPDQVEQWFRIKCSRNKSKEPSGSRNKSKEPLGSRKQVQGTFEFGAKRLWPPNVANTPRLTHRLRHLCIGFWSKVSVCDTCASDFSLKLHMFIKKSLFSTPVERSKV